MLAPFSSSFLREIRKLFGVTHTLYGGSYECWSFEDSTKKFFSFFFSILVLGDVLGELSDDFGLFNDFITDNFKGEARTDLLLLNGLMIVSIDGLLKLGA